MLTVILVSDYKKNLMKEKKKEYLLELWQSEWGEFHENKLHKIFPKLKDCITCPWTNRREMTVVS